MGKWGEGNGEIEKFEKMAQWGIRDIEKWSR